MKMNLDWKNGDALIMLGFYHSEKIKALLKSSRQTILNNATASLNAARFAG